MGRIQDTALPLSKIALLWSRNSTATESELFDNLLCAFWEGDFEGQVTIGDNETKFGREIALKALAKQKEQPRVLFLTKEEDEADPQIADLADGGKVVDLRERVIVPSDGRWTTSLIDQAYLTLAKTCFDDFDSQLSVPLKMITLDKTSFQRWMKNNGLSCAWWGASVAIENPCSVFLAMKQLDASELTITFVGDKSETGLGANNMLEIVARKETRRVALAVLELMDRRTGSANSQGAVLLGIAHKKILTTSGANSAKMKRLRDVFRTHLGVRGDPFEPYRKEAGWVPRFKIIDNRGAADKRAKKEAEQRTDSYEHLNERGKQFADFTPAGSLLDADNDAAAAWLKEHDPNESA